jgi:hypothetical protein
VDGIVNVLAMVTAEPVVAENNPSEGDDVDDDDDDDDDANKNVVGGGAAAGGGDDADIGDELSKGGLWPADCSVSGDRGAGGRARPC